MPFTPQQLVRGADYTLNTYQRKDPIDQINVRHATLDWLVKNKEESNFGNGSFKEPIYVSNDSNAQNYFGADAVTYNERDPARWTDFSWYNVHDGFWFDEDRLQANGIDLTDDGSAVPTGAEKEQLINLLKISYRSLKEGLQEHLAFETLRDGTQSAKATPGLAHLVSANPAVGTVGGIDGATATYWRNNVNTGLSAATLVEDMETTWKDCMRFGGMLPNAIVCGQAFYDAYLTASASAVQRHQQVMGRNGATMDPSINAVNFHGVPLIWDPTFEALDALLSTTTQTKTAYFLNSSAITLRPLKRQWMRTRPPEKPPERYVWYFGKTTKYGFTSNKRNALAMLQLT